jgi:hypothetical protein
MYSGNSGEFAARLIRFADLTSWPDALTCTRLAHLTGVNGAGVGAANG